MIQTSGLVVVKHSNTVIVDQYLHLQEFPCDKQLFEFKIYTKTCLLEESTEYFECFPFPNFATRRDELPPVPFVVEGYSWEW